MNHSQKNCHYHYRITSIEYTHAGYCCVGVERDRDRLRCYYRLYQVCHNLRWLSRFHQVDLITIWRLVKRQSRITWFRRGMSYALIKYLTTRMMLQNWEEDAKRYISGIGTDRDDW